MQLSLISVLSQYLLTFLQPRLLYTKIVDIKFIAHNAFLESLSSGMYDQSQKVGKPNNFKVETGVS